MRFRPEFPSDGTRRAVPRGRSEAPPEDVSAERHRLSQAEGSAITISAHAPCSAHSAQPDGDYLEPIQYVDAFVPAPHTRTEIDGAVLLLHIVQPAQRTRTEMRKQPEMSHGQIASPTRTEDVRFPSADRRTIPAPREQAVCKTSPAITSPRCFTQSDGNFEYILQPRRCDTPPSAGDGQAPPCSPSQPQRAADAGKLCGSTRPARVNAAQRAQRTTAAPDNRRKTLCLAIITQIYLPFGLKVDTIS